MAFKADAGVEGDFTSAVNLFNKENYSQSLSLFQDIVTHYERIGDTDNQRYIVARYYRAKCHFNLHEFEPALNDFLFVDTKNIPLYSIWQDIVKVYILMKEDKLAIHYLEKKLKTEKRFDYLFELGRLYWGIDEREKAIEAFEKARAIDPNDSQLLFYMSYLYWETGDMFKAGKMAKILEEVSFDSLINVYARGMIFFSMGLYEKAVEQFQIALNATPNDETMNSLLLVSLIKSGDLETADLLLQDLLGKKSGDSWLWFKACEIPLIKRDPYGALTIYNALDTKLHNTPQGIYLKVFELVLSGGLEEAEGILKREREKNAEKPDYYPILVGLLMREGKISEIDQIMKRFCENIKTE
ncbi:MAG: tetratricopeptide repeat protein, partial [bacterium]